MDQQQDQGRNQKIPWNKWKWEHNNPNCMRYTKEAALKGKFIALLAYIKLKKKIKSSNKQFNFTLNGTWKRTTSRQKEIIKIAHK